MMLSHAVSFVALLLQGTFDSTGAPGARYWQNRTDYEIAARLDTASQSIYAG